MIFLPDAENRKIVSVPLDNTPERDGQTDISALDITAVCIARNADAL